MKLSKLLLCLSLIGLTTLSHGDEVIELTSGDWAPYQSESLAHYGAAARIITAAYALEGVTVNYKFRPWKRAYQDVQGGADLGSFLWSETRFRKGKFHFSEPIMVGENVFFHLKSRDFDWRELEDLKGLRIGGILGVENKYLETAVAHALERVSYEQQNFAKLLRGRIDIAVADVNVAYDVLHEYFSPEEIAMITYHRRPFRVVEYRLMFSLLHSDSLRMVSRFNRGLEKLKLTGQYDQYIDEFQARLPNRGKLDSPQL